MANPAWCQPIDPSSIEKLQKAAGGWIKMMTLAPEEGNALELIPHLRNAGILPAIGHSNASYEQAMLAFELGINHVTHMFNAMSPFHHRAPGVVGAAFNARQVTTEVIADGMHVHPGAIKTLINMKGIEKICLVSDSAPFAGLPDGNYQWETYSIDISDGTCHLRDGTLAGAHALLDTGIRYMIQKVGIPAELAIACASEVPACIMGIMDRFGSLQPGHEADLVILDQDWKIEETWIGGKPFWRKDHATTN